MHKNVVFKGEALHPDGTAAVRAVIVDPRSPMSNEDMEYQKETSIGS
jgi:hypothetical protein